MGEADFLPLHEPDAEADEMRPGVGLTWLDVTWPLAVGGGVALVTLALGELVPGWNRGQAPAWAEKLITFLVVVGITTVAVVAIVRCARLFERLNAAFPST